MRVFLTGASGYIGLHILSDLLDAGHEVTALVRTKYKLGLVAERSGLKIIEADLTQTFEMERALGGHDVFVHCALIWGAEPGSELSLQDTSVAAKLFNAAGRANVKRCIFISSAAVHRPFSGTMKEDDCLSTTDTYGATKAAGELFLQAACAEHQMKGISLRLGPVLGAPVFSGAAFRSNNRLTEMVKSAIDGRQIEVQEGEGRQWSSVAAVVKTLRILISHANPHPTYLCVDRNVITWEKIASLVVSQLKSESNVRVIPTKEEAPLFDTNRIESLLGKATESTGSLLEHVRYLTTTL